MVNSEQTSSKGMSQAALGRVLGLSPAAITKLKGQGMPVDSVAAAQAWRQARQNVAQRKPAPGLRAGPVPTPAPASTPEPMSASAPTPASVLASAATPAPAPMPRPEFSGRAGGGVAPPLDYPLGEDRDEARTRREIAEANMAEMDEARLRRELIRVSAVQAQLSTDYATTRDAMLQIPARMAPLLAAEKDPAAVQSLLHAEIHQALMTLAGAADHVPTIEGAFD